jgi:hypothetical protein
VAYRTACVRISARAEYELPPFYCLDHEMKTMVFVIVFMPPSKFGRQARGAHVSEVFQMGLPQAASAPLPAGYSRTYILPYAPCNLELMLRNQLQIDTR